MNRKGYANNSVAPFARGKLRSYEGISTHSKAELDSSGAWLCLDPRDKRSELRRCPIIEHKNAEVFSVCHLRDCCG